MAAVDAQFFWMSARLPSDQFLLYAFAGAPADLGAAVTEIEPRARDCPALTVRVDDGCALTYPAWVRADPDADLMFAVHDLADDTWTGCLDAVAALGADQLDAGVLPWRLHVFPGVRELPGAVDGGTVAVLQVAHALADGGRASALAAWLFGRSQPVPAVTARSPGWLPARAVQAAVTHRRLQHDIDAGLLAAPPGPRPMLATNTRPAGPRVVRTLIRRRDQLRGPTVTVAALAAVSSALASYLGGPADLLCAEVPMAKPGVRQANNHFHNVTVGLHPQLAMGERAERIAVELADVRRRARHPAARAADRAFAAVPAPVLRWGVSRFDPEVRPDQVSGNTVLSSVHRGPADLRFGGAPVLLTAGFPALSPAIGITHGVHGIGDTIAISVHAAQSAFGDIDGYLRYLDAML